MAPRSIITQDQRRHPRAAFPATATLWLDGIELGSYRVYDLSAGGAYVYGASPPLGTRVGVRLRSDRLGTLQLTADVVRRSVGPGPQGFGLRFCTPPSRIESMIVCAVLGELARSPMAMA